MIQVLSHINKIQFIDTRHLQNITIIPGVGIMLNYWRNFTELPLANLASMEVVSKVENNSRLFTTTIKALLTNHFDITNRRLAYMVTTVEGKRFFIGSGEAPYPVSNTTDTFPEKTTDQSGQTLSVEYTDTLGLMPVLD